MASLSRNISRRDKKPLACLGASIQTIVSHVGWDEGGVRATMNLGETERQKHRKKSKSVSWPRAAFARTRLATTSTTITTFFFFFPGKQRYQLLLGVGTPFQVMCLCSLYFFALPPSLSARHGTLISMGAGRKKQPSFPSFGGENRENREKKTRMQHLLSTYLHVKQYLNSYGTCGDNSEGVINSCLP